MGLSRSRSGARDRSGTRTGAWTRNMSGVVTGIGTGAAWVTLQ